MARFDLTDAEWAVIEPLLPTDVRGKERADDRRVLNGIFWRLRTGAPWADIPARYGPHTTCGNRFRRWRKRGIWVLPRLVDRLVRGVEELNRQHCQRDRLRFRRIGLRHPTRRQVKRERADPHKRLLHQEL